jgi:membrane associated rhomboid family serine protease
MAARVCPYCRELNSVSEKRCFRCGRRLPGPLSDKALGFVRELLGAEAPVTRIILFLELLVFGLCVVVDPGVFHNLLTGTFKRSTLLRFGALAGPLGELEPWRYLSAVFVHMGVLHVVMNLWMFVDLGRNLERGLGGARLALIFLVTGVLGFVVSALWYAPTQPFTAGASGGVFGQIGALVGVLWARGDPEWKGTFMRYLAYAVLLSLAIGGINTAAHLGGFAAGIGLGYLFGWERGRLRLEWPLRILAAAGLLAVVVSVGLSMRSEVWQGMRAHELMNE